MVIEMTTETPNTTKSGRPRQRSPKHWYEHQKIFNNKIKKKAAYGTRGRN